ncbi:MAG TPA: AEC family transporter [Burkholderiales bacterium]|nr:AEC family transporter [Burkholderiales bacterium]
MLLRIVSILAPMMTVLLVGYLYGRIRKPDMAFANQLTMDVFVPALILAALADKSFALAAYLPLLAGGVAVILGSGFAAVPVARALGIPLRTFLPSMMFKNSGNLGLPLIVLAFGEAALAPAIVLWLASTLLHFSLGAWMLDRHTRLSQFWRIPVVAATLVGLGLNITDTELWPPLQQGIKMLGDISVPLLLFALGARLVGADFGEWRVGLWGAVAGPATGVLCAAAAAHLLRLPAEQTAILLVFGALPPAILNYVFAERYHQEPARVASIVFVGTLAAAAFLPLALLVAL